MTTRRSRGGSGGRFGCGAAAALLAALLGASPALAGDAGVRLGIYDGADSDEAVLTAGVFGRLDIPGPLNLELSADYREESLDDGAIDATVVPLRATLLLNVLPGISPYLLAGAGADFVAFDFGEGLDTGGDDTSLVFELHAGAGLEIGLGPLTVIADLRYCAAEETDNDAVRRALGHDYDASGWHATLAASFGF